MGTRKRLQVEVEAELLTPAHRMSTSVCILDKTLELKVLIGCQSVSLGVISAFSPLPLLSHTGVVRDSVTPSEAKPVDSFLFLCLLGTL